MTKATERIRRMTTFAVVLHVATIEPHPDPRMTRVEVLTLSNGAQLLTGKHYRAGDRGIFLRAGCLIPGWLAEDLWMCGKERSRAWFEVMVKPVGHPDGDGPKVESVGLWCGEFWRVDPSMPFQRWQWWREEWEEGYTLDGFFGIVEAVAQPVGSKLDPRLRKHRIRPRSSTAERPASNRETAAERTPTPVGASEASGSTPAAGLADLAVGYQQSGYVPKRFL